MEERDVKIPIENNGASPLYVGGQMIPAGETRHFDEHEVPAEYKPAAPEPEEAPPPDPLGEILAGPVKGILAGVGALDMETLQGLLAREQERWEPRKTLVEGLSAEVLRRQSAALDGAAGEADKAGHGESES